MSYWNTLGSGGSLAGRQSAVELTERKGEHLEQEIHDEIESALRLAERKPKLVEALLQERREIDVKLAALGYVPPKRTRKPRTATNEPPYDGMQAAAPKRRRTKAG